MLELDFLEICNSLIMLSYTDTCGMVQKNTNGYCEDEERLYRYHFKDGSCRQNNDQYCGSINNDFISIAECEEYCE